MDGTNLASDNPQTQPPPPATYTKKQEIRNLQELVRLYQNCPERAAAYTRWKWISTWTAWLLLFVSFFLSGFESVNSGFCCALAVLAGVGLGLAIWFANAAKQTPLLVRFTTLREDEIQKRLKELE